MDTAQSLVIQPAVSQGAMTYYAGSKPTAGDLSLEIQNGILPWEKSELHVKLWIGGVFQGKQVLYYRGVWGNPTRPMLRKGEAVKIVAHWQGVKYGPIKFHAATKPERVSFFNAGDRLRIVHNGATV
jgi:hypothetical protein